MTTIAVTRLPVDTGRSGWEAISRRPFPARTLDTDLRADWLIIGAGFAGLSAARRLTQLRPGERIVVLDARELAEGPAGRNSGFMIDVPHNLSAGDYSSGDAAGTRLEMAQNRLGIAFATEAAAEYRMPREIFDPCGKINAAASERGETQNRNFAASLAAIGEPLRQIDAAGMREITGSDYYRGGLYTPGAVLIEPAAYIRAFAAGLGERIDVYENSPVTALTREDGTWTAATPKGRVTAPRVILAVNGLVQAFGHFERRLMHVFTYASMTVPFADKAGQDRWALLPADPMGATVRKVTHGTQSRIVIRTRFTYDPSLEVSEARVAATAAKQRRSFDARFPDLAGLGFEYSWAGRLCLSLNSVPAFGEVDEGLFSACCCNGLGSVKSTLAGKMAAELATGTRSVDLDTYKDRPAPRRLPPEPIATIGARARIRWQEMQAGREG
ncbi:glycine/D-amino acid oxidase-like deaminating enzyme [Amaricoccus macauensis]|uniref:Glycine/D-amino acid oxidase-like deaminating enzyme n=1 Tax=Amaricoccus macauensis TaxID=57001 RepID=A0A840SSX9_9RHOB|nr:FAD-binding oxidoreductase [Amaricoccus macauensis]MBB5223860.1 glycine/D-amino acid oxidase-like deaminating enzyme [Amaricoccus macauensis]